MQRDGTWVGVGCLLDQVGKTAESSISQNFLNSYLFGFLLMAFLTNCILMAA